MTSPSSADTLAQLERGITQLIAAGANPEKFVARTVAELPVLVSAMTSSGVLLFASPRHLLLSGVQDSLAELKTDRDLFPSFISERFPPALHKVVMEHELRRWDLSVQHKDGDVVVYDVRHHLFSIDGKEDIILTLGMDVTQCRQADEAVEPTLEEQKNQLTYQSFHDPLTGLANRSLFYDRVHKCLSRARRTKGNIALLLVDLDRFKNINDSLGRDAGDYYLKRTAARMAQTLRDTDTVARLSGDEFIVVLESISQAQDIAAIAQKILNCISQPIDVMGHEISATASIGVSLYPKDGDSIDQLLKYADLAMSSAKTLGKNCTQFYVKAMTDNAVNYLLLENDLRKAIENDELCLHYQPQVDLQNGKIAGLEALVRWNHKERGLISPMEFIPLAEETGLIEPLGNWVLREACERFNSWRMRGINFGKIAVNLSARQFRQSKLDDIIVKTLAETCLPPECLELEITESSAMENAAEAIELLNGFAKMGLSLAIDDFGTGYSSLAYLKRFPINKLKIDRSFIKDIDHDDAGASIAKSIIDLAHNMSLKVVAEGVERLAQSIWLSEKECDQVQGFFYARPIPESELLALALDEDKAKVSKTGVYLLSLNKP